jgi:hypothetical protein
VPEPGDKPADEPLQVPADVPGHLVGPYAPYRLVQVLHPCDNAVIGPGRIPARADYLS